MTGSHPFLHTSTDGTSRRRLWPHLLLAGFVATHLACVEFDSTTVPIVEQGKGVHPIEDGEYQLFLSATSVSPLQTGIYLERTADHYRVRYLPMAKTTFSLDVFRGMPGFDEAAISKDAPPESSEELLEGAAAFLEMLEGDAPGGAPPPSDTSPAQRALLQEAAGFSMAALENGYFVHQTPATFLPSRWPVSKEHEKPRWSVKAVRVEGTTITFYESAAASASASKAIFGTRETCRNDTCETVLNVDKFTDTAELNRQILLRAVRDFGSELKLKYRLVRTQAGN